MSLERIDNFLVICVFRFMATNDLMTELQKDSIKLDDDSERKVSIYWSYWFARIGFQLVFTDRYND